MKRILALMLTILLFATFVGCSNSGKSGTAVSEFTQNAFESTEDAEDTAPRYKVLDQMEDDGCIYSFDYDYSGKKITCSISDAGAAEIRTKFIFFVNEHGVITSIYQLDTNGNQRTHFEAEQDEIEVIY